MRLLILAAGAALSLSACGSDDEAGNTATANAGLTAESIVTNDVTAIDAVTGAAANMAADVDINFTNDMLEPAGNATAPAKRPAKAGDSSRRAPRPRAPAPDARPKEETADTAGNSTE